jgi:hypothetical protein
MSRFLQGDGHDSDEHTESPKASRNHLIRIARHRAGSSHCPPGPWPDSRHLERDRQHTGNQRSFYTATRLQNGQVLVAGGFNNAIDQIYATAFLYNPSTGTWTETGTMTEPRYHHTATLLNNGQVLVTGGLGAGGDSAELYNPSTGTWSATGSMTVSRFYHSAVLLQNGEVLVAGGDIGNTTTNAAEIYNPFTGTFTATGSMNDGRVLTQLTLLQNGEVLIAGGNGASGGNASCTAELFSNGQWRLTANLVQCAPASEADSVSAALLPNGNVLIEDGNTASEFYDPSTNVWQATLNQPNVQGPLALLTNGQVLIAGVALLSGGSNAALYDPSTNEWTPTASSHIAAAPLTEATLTRLLNGEVLKTARDDAALFTL